MEVIIFDFVLHHKMYIFLFILCQMAVTYIGEENKSYTLLAGTMPKNLDHQCCCLFLQWYYGMVEHCHRKNMEWTFSGVRPIIEPLADVNACLACLQNCSLSHSGNLPFSHF